MQAAFEAIIAGRVQMVMYRDFALRAAHEAGITGEVKNMDDNSVFVHAEGDKEKLEAFVEKLNTGPLLAQVETMRVTWIPPSGTYTDFSITH